MVSNGFIFNSKIFTFSICLVILVLNFYNFRIGLFLGLIQICFKQTLIHAYYIVRFSSDAGHWAHGLTLRLLN